MMGKNTETESQEVEIIEETQVIEYGDVVLLSKPYKFEGKRYENLDLSGLENIKARDMIEANRVHDRAGGFSLVPEMSMEYTLLIASRATGLPIEFFYGLPPKDAIRIKNKVTGFFYGQD